MKKKNSFFVDFNAPLCSAPVKFVIKKNAKKELCDRYANYL